MRAQASTRARLCGVVWLDARLRTVAKICLYRGWQHQPVSGYLHPNNKLLASEIAKTVLGDLVSLAGLFGGDIGGSGTKPGPGLWLVVYFSSFR
jgi:hypothetical protein